ncbi:MAG: ubiquitin-activating E1 FCCH domain-containing protein [Pseudomonadota bacterium]
MLWGLSASVLVGMTGLTIDFTRAQVIRTQIQNAADGAALVAARNASTMSLSDRTALARAYFDAEAGEYGQGAEFSLTPLDDNTYKVNVDVSMPGSLTKLISAHDWNIGVESEAVHGGTNIEVALVLDTTGSMSGSKISDLRGAATDFVNTVVNDVQTPFYSKVALVPFSAGVNVGSYSDTAHGTVPGGKTITGASWSTGTAMTVTAITKANPAVVTTSAAHGFTSGNTVYLSGISGMTQVNNHYYTVTPVSGQPTKFQLNGVNSSSYSTFSTSGSPRATKCQTSACEVVVTANSHGFSNGAYVYITGVNGMTQINNATGNGSSATSWLVAGATTNSFVLSGSTGPSYSAYTNSGSVYCTTLGCNYYRFTNASNTVNVWPINASCVSDRVGGHANDAASPSTALVGYNYPVPGNGDTNSRCPTTSIVPLTATKSTLTSAISTLTASSYTGGQIGTAWGWYMISPDWNTVWTGTSAPAAYNAPQTAKVAVIMTDGTYNLMYCNGVMSKDAGSGSSTNHANCNAPNGDGTAQAQAICTAMKAKGIIIYTVGFDMSGEPQSSTTMLTQCATSPSYFYNADDGTALHQAFASIATSISQLRISH